MVNHVLGWASLSALVLAVAGCGASIPGLSTSALSNKPQAPQNDPTSRALQVGSTSARAQKCGFNFDPAKLRTQFLAAEAATNPADSDKLSKIYDTAFNGVSKAVAGQGESYCSETKVAQIKTDLSRHLTGDYTAPPPAPVQEEEGLLGDLSSPDDGESEYRQKMQRPPEDW